MLVFLKIYTSNSKLAHCEWLTRGIKISCNGKKNFMLYALTSQCSRVASYTRIGEHTTQQHGVIHMTRIITSTKTPLPSQQ